MVKYKKSFLDKTKSLFPYLVKFSEDEFILPKEYHNDYTVGGSDQRPIMIIPHDDNTLSTYDGYQKRLTFNC